MRILSALLVTVLVLGAIGLADTTAHTYLGNNPDEGNPGWHTEAQGLAHDADNWYITQNPPILFGVIGGPRLWRVPVTTNLSHGVDCGEDGVQCSLLLATPLADEGYNHYGDPDVFEFGGRAYLLVPIEGGDPGPGVAVFRADVSLEYLAFAPFPGQTHSGWVAADSAGVLVSSESDGFDHFVRFAVDWAAFQASGEHTLTVVPVAPMLLRDESDLPLEIGGAQGGEFADDRPDHLYYSGGGFGDFDDTWGVHVFETTPGTAADCAGVGDGCVIARRIERSHNSSGGFAYEFNTSNFEEPEGLTFWDLDADGRAPGLRGQLHVVLLDNDVLTSDDVYVKHYRREIGDTTAPVLTCPADASVECKMPAGVFSFDPVLAPFFAGATAIDAIDPSPLVTNDSPSIFALGRTPVTFTATDASRNASSCVARVAVVDTTAPVVSCSAPVVVECTGPAGIAKADPQLVPFFAAASAIDTCDLSPAIANDAPAVLPPGLTNVRFSAQDLAGNVGACLSSVRVADTRPPQIAVALSPATLWPPNHKMVPITATVTATDRCDPTLTIQLVSITSNQPPAGDDVQGAAIGSADTSFALRAEREGSAGDRVYTVVYRATDGAGNSSTAAAQVRVPHDRR